MSSKALSFPSGSASENTSNQGDLQEATHQIFTLLKKLGPLCPSQLSVELGLSLKQVAAALKGLRELGLAEPRPDRDDTRKYEDDEAAWGLTLSLSRRA